MQFKPCENGVCGNPQQGVEPSVLVRRALRRKGEEKGPFVQEADV